MMQFNGNNIEYLKVRLKKSISNCIIEKRRILVTFGKILGKYERPWERAFALQADSFAGAKRACQLAFSEDLG